MNEETFHIISYITVFLLAALVFVTGFLLYRVWRRYEAVLEEKGELEKKGRMRQEVLDIAHTVASYVEIEKLLYDLLPKLNEATRSTCSAFYSVNSMTQKLEIRHSVGFSKSIYGEFDLRSGEGLVGQAALKKDVTLVRDIPEDTVYVTRTFLGKIKPRSMMIVPIIAQDKPAGVLVCASIYDYTREDQDMIELTRHYLGVAVNNSVNYEKNKRMANELDFQNKLIREQYEEMKKRLDERTQLLNNWVNYADGTHMYALDTRGVVLAWSREAENLHGISGKLTLGKLITRVYEENGWPSISEAFHDALAKGDHTETLRHQDVAYELHMECIHNEQKEAVGVMASVRKA